MASSYCRLFFSILFISLISTSILAQPSFRPSALVIPVTKDAATLQYVTEIPQRTPLVPISLVIDLGGRYSWIDCDDPIYVSSTNRAPQCGSAACSLSQSDSCGTCNAPTPSIGCHVNTCRLTPDNTVTGIASDGEQASDVFSVSSTDGSNPGRTVSVPNVIFSCGLTFLLKGLAAGVKGMAGFGRTKVSLPPQFSAAFSFDRKFAVCLSSSEKGVIFFGDGPYNFLPNVKAADSLVYTPLLINPFSTSTAFQVGEKSSEYFIGVKSITVGVKLLTLNSTLLSIDSSGIGGTKISTVNPYTVLETSIYTALTKSFVSQIAAMNVSRVSAVTPFEFCFSSTNVGSTRVGPAVPYISLGLHNKDTVWTITGSNSMVYVNDEKVVCLGFVNGGANPRTSVVIGGKQLEDNLLQFDLAASKVGFSSTLLGRSTTCANFNFTSNA